ncbi:MAG: hypothetical protein AAF591_07195 [Verrucomicrobiota bacterium]
MIGLGNATALVLPLSILLGLGVGAWVPHAREPLGSLIDPLVLTLLALLFFEVRFTPLVRATRHLRFLSLAWAANFIIIPIIGWGIASLFFSNSPALFTGLLLYLLFPCTDWFLGFTRLARGDVALGSVLLPINLISQLLLFPIFLAVFVGARAGTDLAGLWGTVAQWFLLPFIGAVLVRLLLSRLLPKTRFETLPRLAGSLVPWILGALVCCIFARHATALTTHPEAFGLILLAVFLFFILTSLLSGVLARRFHLDHPQHVLLAMTTAARNAPLILGLATIALPDQPLVYAALIIGMLVEFPHLTVLSRLLLRQEYKSSPSPGKPLTTT